MSRKISAQPCRSDLETSVASSTSDQMDILYEGQYDDLRPGTRIEDILSVWPTLHSLAESLSAGDLISLSRTSRTVRNVTHAFDSSTYTTGSSPLNLGHHETLHWTALKSASPFTCISPTHKDPKSISSSPDHSRKSTHPIRPCNFCSRPICRTCIVRSFFADPTQSRNTFRHRTRHLCTKCWDSGNLRKDYRYPLHVSTSSREHIWHGQNYALRGQRCTCSASEDNWLCQPCRVLQNESGPGNVSFFDVVSRRPLDKGKQRGDASIGNQIPGGIDVPCYGLNCTDIISASDGSRDRRRICLWCSRPLARPFGGEDRLRWEEKQLTIRAAHAASRSADIAEWARNRFRSLTMSRRDMRGTEVCSTFLGPAEIHDRRVFVKHLDAVNYRALIGEHAAPTPEDVYNSKHGYWRYGSAFLGNRSFCERHKGGYVGKVWVDADEELQPPEGTNSDELYNLTSAGALPLARRNKDLRPRLGGIHGGIHMEWNERPKEALVRLAVQLHHARLMSEEEFHIVMDRRYRFGKVEDWEDALDRMYQQLIVFEARDEESVAARDIGETFSDVLKEKCAVTLRPNRDVLNSDEDDVLRKAGKKNKRKTDAQAGPSTSANVNNNEESVIKNPLTPASSSEDQSWVPPVPEGSPPPFTATEVDGRNGSSI